MGLLAPSFRCYPRPWQTTLTATSQHPFAPSHSPPTRTHIHTHARARAHAPPPHTHAHALCPSPPSPLPSRYDRSDNSWRSLVDVQLVCAMGPPGGGRNPVSPRFVRHCNLVAVTEFDDATYTRIYSAVCDWWFARAKIGDEVGLAAAVWG